MSPTDVELESRHSSVTQLRVLAGSLARRSVRPAVQLLVVVVAMVVAASAPAALVVLAPAAVAWRLHRRRQRR